jgi:hypothetical protein
VADSGVIRQLGVDEFYRIFNLPVTHAMTWHDDSYIPGNKAAWAM